MWGEGVGVRFRLATRSGARGGALPGDRSRRRARQGSWLQEGQVGPGARSDCRWHPLFSNGAQSLIRRVRQHPRPPHRHPPAPNGVCLWPTYSPPAPGTPAIGPWDTPRQPRGRDQRRHASYLRHRPQPPGLPPETGRQSPVWALGRMCGQEAQLFRRDAWLCGNVGPTQPIRPLTSCEETMH